MSELEAFILGLLQGLTEFLPVSSSGHLELGKALFGVEAKDTLLFTVVVHGATVLSTIVVFRKDLRDLFTDSLSFKWNDSTRYIVKLLISMIPVIFLGLFFKEEIERFFDKAVDLNDTGDIPGVVLQGRDRAIF
jgi:undecaprenyl-diphosphatase